jgi:hypothetical protein
MIRRSLCAVSADNCFYVGLGDRFDDDRRLVREATSELLPGNTSHLDWPKSSINSRRN